MKRLVLGFAIGWWLRGEGDWMRERMGENLRQHRSFCPHCGIHHVPGDCDILDGVS